MDSEFPSNSGIPPKSNDVPPASPQKEEVTKVISGEPIVRKKSLLKQFTSTFTPTSTKSVVEWVYTGVIIPAVKQLIFESAKQGLSMKLFGDSAPGGYQAPGFGQSVAYTAYNRMSQPMVAPAVLNRPDPRMPQPGQMTPHGKRMHDFKEILIPSRAEAIVVLEKLYSLLSQFEVVTVADFYSACGITPAFPDEQWGWFSLQGSDVAHTSQGWLVDLPPAVPLTNQ